MASKAKVLTLSAFIAAAVSGSVYAQDHSAEVTVMGGRIFFDDPLEDSNTWGAAVGFPINDNWTLETVWSRYDTETSADATDVDGTQYRVDGIYNVNTESQWKPYLAMGVGDLKREWNNGGVKDSARETLVNLGAGIKHDLGGNWQFRTDLRAFRSLDNDYTDLALNLGLTYLFGKGAAPVKAEPVVAAPVAKPEMDTDGDGVVDSKDQCADTPKTNKVDAVGCSLKLTETVSIKLNITFDSAKSVIKPQFDDEVKKLADFMNQYADTVVTVEGHTDSQGADAYNLKLSQSRADAVKANLVANYGISADRVTAKGFGETQPIADNATAAGREENRRVVAQVSTKVTKTETRN